MNPYFARTSMFAPAYSYSPQAAQTEATVNLMGYMIGLVVTVTIFLLNKRDQFLSAPKSLNERSIAGLLNPNEVQSKRYGGNDRAVSEVVAAAPKTKEAIKQEIIEKQTKAFDIFNKIFDIAVYSVIPVVLISAIAFMATASAGVGMAVLGPFLCAIGGLFLTLMITQAASFGLLYHSHKNIDNDIKNSIENEIDKIHQTVNNINNDVLNDIAENNELNNEKNEILAVLDNCKPMNLVICIRDLNLAKIHQSIDEYNDLIQSGIHSKFKALDLMDSDLVNGLIIMLGSLFINDQNETCTYDYTNYATTVKADILTLLNSSEVDILSPLVNALSRRDANDKTNNKDYSLLKQAIVAKLEGITSSNSVYSDSRFS